MLKQSDAVYQAVVSVLNDKGISWETGDKLSDKLNDEMRASVNMIVYQGFIDGNIALGASYTESQIKKYVPGLVSNHLRKDKRLNGGTKYEIQNPGSRAGAGDEQLKALRAVLASTTDESARAEIQVFIDKRVAELAAAKKPKVEINVDALPAELRAKLGC